MSIDRNILELRDVSFAYPGSAPVLRNINLHVAPGECVCLLGSSGAGKTSLLRMIAGFLRPTQGHVVYRPNANIREIACVSQHYTLFPHLTASQNVELVLRRRSPFWRRLVPDQTTKLRSIDLLDRVGLTGRASALPMDLSGGQRQRVCIAQALAQDTPLLLLDEPFGALDEDIREQLQDLVIRLVKEQSLAILFVTHDLEEALYLSDRLYLLRPSPEGASIEEYPIGTTPIRTPEIKQSESFFKELQGLRARFYRAATLAERENSNLHLTERGIIDETTLAAIERTAADIWVISAELRQDMDNPVIRDAVESNFREGKRYRYVIPEGSDVAMSNVQRVREQYPNHSQQISVQTLPRDTSIFYFGEVVLYDPLTDAACGYSYLGGEHRGMMVKLPERFVRSHACLVERINS